MKIPKWLKKYAHEEDLGEISKAVKDAESHTSGEIVPMVVLRSSPIAHVFWFLWLFCLALFSSGLWLMEIHPEHWSSADWGHGLLRAQWWLGGMGFSFLLALILSRLLFVQRLLSPWGEMRQEVMKRAELEFYANRFHHTSKSTGILLFVSVMERQAVVLADDAISKKLNADTWKEAVDKLLAGLGQKSLKSGMVPAIVFCGQLLRQHFPIAADDRNEIANDLVIKE